MVREATKKKWEKISQQLWTISKNGEQDKNKIGDLFLIHYLMHHIMRVLTAV